jgi:hypothetical protein
MASSEGIGAKGRNPGLRTQAIQARNTVAAKPTNPADAPIVQTDTLTLKAFPSSSTQYFIVELQSMINEKAQLKVVDLLGRQCT